MKKKDILVIGGGISGLSLGWYLQQFAPWHEVTVIEKATRVGGIVHAVQKEGVHFDEGPKTLRASHGEDTLALIHALGLQKDLIISSKAASIRYIYCHQRLCPLSNHPLQWLKAPLMRKAVISLLKEGFVPSNHYYEESVGSFIKRRLGSDVANYLMEPFILGTSGGDMDQLSLEEYFPKLSQWERRYGSILKGMWQERGVKKPIYGIPRGVLFNLQGGVSQLVEKLRLALRVGLGCEVLEVRAHLDKVEVITTQGKMAADHVVLALPGDALQKIILPLGLQRHSFLEKMQYGSFVGVGMAYAEDVLSKKGFGYLIPSLEKEQILGVVFDSEIFASKKSTPTQLTVMIGGHLHAGLMYKTDEELVDIAKKALCSHMKISQCPKTVHVMRYPKAITHLHVGHRLRLENFCQELKKACPQVILAGNYLTAASVNNCIRTAKTIAAQFI